MSHIIPSFNSAADRPSRIASMLLAAALLAGCGSVDYRVTTGILLGDEVERISERHDQQPGEIHGYQAGGTVGVEFSQDGVSAVEICGLAEFSWKMPYATDDPTARGLTPGMVPFSFCAEFDA